MVTQIPFEYMHLVCLGVVRKLLNLWLRGGLKYRISQSTANKISEALIHMRSFIPKEFARKPRSLKELDRWKATEFRQLLLYTGPLVLASLPKHIFDHFMTLHCAIFIMCNPAVKTNDALLEYAHSLLKYFVGNFMTLYGKESISYNVHGLLHLVDDVKTFGALDDYSAFPFENFKLYAAT